MVKAKKPVFVIQEHRATHLHYDFRLEMDGVLKSWAIPKEPSTDTKIKRLAVQVDDHKLGYESFEGVIPEGMYGAGPVKIWDKGSYELKERTGDKIVFNLNGKRLKGEFTLVKFKKAGPKSWLFFKTGEKDRLKFGPCTCCHKSRPDPFSSTFYGDNIVKIGFRHTMFIASLILFLCFVCPIDSSHAETLFLSVDSGSKWTKISQDYNIVSFTISKVDSSIWGLTKEGYIIYSADQGKNWIKKGKLPENIKKDLYYAYIIFSEKYNTLFAGAWRVGLFKSENLGISWEKLKVKSIATLEIEQNSGEIYAGSWGTVLKSIDNGNTWEEFKPWIGGQWIADIAISPLDKKKVYLGLYGTIAKTDNGGKTWITSQDKFGHNDFGNFPISRIIPSSKKESLLYAICGLGIFYSRDNGAKWEPLVKFKKWISYYTFWISESNENVIFVSKDCEFLKSENYGKTWKIQKNPFLGEYARKIIIDSSTQKGAIYVLTWLKVDV